MTETGIYEILQDLKERVARLEDAKFQPESRQTTMLLDAVQENLNPNLRAIIFSASFSEMSNLADKTRRLYLPLSGTFVGSPKYTWTFKSGATIRFACLKTDDDVWKYMGPRYSFIGFDDSLLHTEKQIRNLIGRLGSTDQSLRLRIRFAREASTSIESQDLPQEIFSR